MRKTVLVIVFVIIGLVAVAAFLRFVVGGSEDDWICVNGEWVEHGKPSAPKPATVCKSKTEPDQETESVSLALDPVSEATHLSKVGGEIENAYWVRGGWYYWNSVEEEKGNFDWDFFDEQVDMLQDDNAYIVPVIFPFAAWDQETCHPEKKYEAEFDARKGGRIKVGKPCDIDAYANFLTKTVERYDGDGTDDMPGLKIPIKYWEIMNEPSMQGGEIGGMGEDLKFFVGTQEEYVEILKASYQTIKQADPEAKVLHAGMAGVSDDDEEFWGPIFAAGAGEYFDIANIHTINTHDDREDMYVLKAKRLFEKYGLSDKPIWITEVQFGELAEAPDNIEEFNQLMVRATAFSLALGADKLFLIENWVFWDDFDDQDMTKPKDMEEKEPKDKKKDKDQVPDSPTQRVYTNLVNKINSFDTIETIKEEYTEGPSSWDGAICQVCQYKFISDDSAVYVLWGQADLPQEIAGQVTLTDIYGEAQIVDASQIRLSEEPVFVELVE